MWTLRKIGYIFWICAEKSVLGFPELPWFRNISFFGPVYHYFNAAPCYGDELSHKYCIKFMRAIQLSQDVYVGSYWSVIHKLCEMA